MSSSSSLMQPASSSSRLFLGGPAAGKGSGALGAEAPGSPRGGCACSAGSSCSSLSLLALLARNLLAILVGVGPLLREALLEEHGCTSHLSLAPGRLRRRHLEHFTHFPAGKSLWPDSPSISANYCWNCSWLTCVNTSVTLLVGAFAAKGFGAPAQSKCSIQPARNAAL